MSALAVDVVKRHGKRPSEKFDPGKLYASLYAACVSTASPDGVAHDAASSACDTVVVWCVNKPEITTTDIRARAARALEQFHPDAAYLYKNHKQIM